MPYFMDDRGPDFFPNFVFGLGISFQRLLKNEDDIRRVVAVGRAAEFEGDPVIEAEKVPGGSETHILDDFRRREILDQEGYVFDPFPEILGQAVDGFGD